jgi:2-polyprenyl-6-methoxyphenol hydroxylase-like FAD-dependent oxidoreductase
MPSDTYFFLLRARVKIRYGYPNVVFGRPDLFQMLTSHIPSGKILMGKRILSSSQTELGVMVRCSDGSSYHGDVLVGADGAYSSVRQCMHKTLKEKGMLPKSDSEKLKFDQHCVVGITDELDPERFPILKEDLCEVYGVIGKKRPYTVSNPFNLDGRFRFLLALSRLVVGTH